jgi:hypothetical protein
MLPAGRVRVVRLKWLEQVAWFMLGIAARTVHEYSGTSLVQGLICLSYLSQVSLWTSSVNDKCHWLRCHAGDRRFWLAQCGL